MQSLPGSDAAKTISTSIVKTISLKVELANAGLASIVAAIGTFTGYSVTTSSDIKSLQAAAIGAGTTALVTFGNSLKNWLSQNSGI